MPAGTLFRKRAAAEVELELLVIRGSGYLGAVVAVLARVVVVVVVEFCSLVQCAAHSLRRIPVCSARCVQCAVRAVR